MPRGRRGKRHNRGRNLTVDLHGCRHEEAKEELIDFIESFYNSNRECIIVTGNSIRMKMMVKAVLSEYKLDYQEGDLLGNNKGYIKTYL